MVSKSLDHTLVQTNKVLALAGMHMLLVALIAPFVSLPACLSFLSFSSLSSELYAQSVFFDAIVLLVVHSMYSVYKYYNTSNIPVLSREYLAIPFDLLRLTRGQLNIKQRYVVLKRVSILAGVAANITAAWVYLYLYATPLRSVLSATAVLLIGMTVAHFYLMEVDVKLKLQVRPFGYLPFLLAPVALAFVLRHKLMS